jgi:hypothetical protein
MMFSLDLVNVGLGSSGAAQMLLPASPLSCAAHAEEHTHGFAFSLLALVLKPCFTGASKASGGGWWRGAGRGHQRGSGEVNAGSAVALRCAVAWKQAGTGACWLNARNLRANLQHAAPCFAWQLVTTTLL